LDQPPAQRAAPDAAAGAVPVFDPKTRTDRPRDYDMRIDLNGDWFHEGGRIPRLPLVRLFASVLRRDADGGYWLATPVEHGRILVEDVSFIATEMAVEGEGRDQVIRLRSNIDDWATLGPDHPLAMRPPPAGLEASGPLPYVAMRPGLEARLSRSVYYELVALGEQQEAPKGTVFGVWSSGIFLALGNDVDGFALGG
jgi:hypothetical protein